MKVYIASPYTIGDVAVNVRNAIIMADYLANLDVHPKCPLLTHFWHLVTPRPYSFWLAYDLVEMMECDVLIRIAGESNGADQETNEWFNKKTGPMYYFDKTKENAWENLHEFIQRQKKIYDP